MKNAKFEKTSKKEAKPNKEAINKLEFQEKYLLKSKNTNNFSNIKVYKSNKKNFYSYIFSFINIINIYLFNRKEKKDILIARDESQIKLNLEKLDLLENQNI